MIEELDDKALLVKESKLPELKARLEKVRLEGSQALRNANCGEDARGYPRDARGRRFIIDHTKTTKTLSNCIQQRYFSVLTHTRSHSQATAMKCCDQTTKRIMSSFVIHPPFPNFVPTSDAVRGGNSHSDVSLPDDYSYATFIGHLDPSVLNAGFAGAFSAGTTTLPNGPTYSGISIELADVSGDPKVAVLVLKEETEEDVGRYKEKKGGMEKERKESTVSWEAKIELKDGRQEIPWDAFEKTYRGRQVDGSHIDTAKIKRWGILVRSFFGEVKGDYKFTVTEMGMYHGQEEKMCEWNVCNIL